MTFLGVELPVPSWATVTEGIRDGVLVGAAMGVLLFPLYVAPGATRLPASDQALLGSEQSQPARRHSGPLFADFGNEKASPDARHVADWVADSGDNGNFDFVIVDKKFAKVYVFDRQARLRGATPILLGAAPGDDSVPGIGSRPLADIREEERTTPAGRFLGQRGFNASQEDVVWVDYNAAVSMHRVRPTDPKERRLERLASETIDDNRISWGCINIPIAFFEGLLQPVFAQRKAFVYVLPEVKDVQMVFGSYDVATKHAIRKPHKVAVAQRLG